MWGGAKLSKNAIVEIVGKLYDALQLNPATDEINCVHFSTGIYEAVVSCDEVDDRMKAIAYCVMDVNEDGVEELLIVDTVWPEPGNVRILDMYTLVEGTPVKVIEGWARNRYYLLDDGKIYSSGSGGAAFSNEELLEFDSGATALTSKELYFTYPKDNDMNNVGYFYSGDGMYNFTFNYGESSIIRRHKNKIKEMKKEKFFFKLLL